MSDIFLDRVRALMGDFETVCVGCGKKPEEIDEYVEIAAAEGVTPEQFVRTEEGTYNRSNGHFCCTNCYVKLGMPSSPQGWIAP